MRFRGCLLAFPLTLSVVACGGTRPAPRGPAAPVVAPDVDADGPPMAIADAALPYAIVDGHTGRAVPEATFWAAVDGAQAVCVGEEHPNPHHHWAQLHVVEHLAGAAGAGRRALGLEMIQQPFQGVVDDFAAGAIDEPTFVSRVGWADRWGYPWSYYQPSITHAIAHGWSVRALNARAELVKRVGKVGVAGLDPVERAELPELVLDDARHRAWFDGVMRAMGDHGGANMPSADNMYAAQVVWDESMAAGAHAWLAGGGDAIVILAGTGHCQDGAVAGRLERRGVARVVTVRPIIDDGEGAVADALTEANADYLFVMTPPTGP
ncbi:MAG: ChaN family lipoprotein [Kofleriaceae bacterium]